MSALSLQYIIYIILTLLSSLAQTGKCCLSNNYYCLKIDGQYNNTMTLSIHRNYTRTLAHVIDRYHMILPAVCNLYFVLGAFRSLTFRVSIPGHHKRQFLTRYRLIFNLFSPCSEKIVDVYRDLASTANYSVRTIGNNLVIENEPRRTISVGIYCLQYMKQK